MNRFELKFLHLEYALLALIAVGFGYSFWHFFTYQYFTQPFFYDIGDTWMDWFNPAYWSHERGAYDTYKTIYPPLTFVILRAITTASCYPGAMGGWSRDCDVLGIVLLHLIYVACVILTAMTLMKVDRKTALPRSIAISIGLPMLWGLDRGNVILITYIFVLLAYGPLLKAAWLRWLFAGLAVNMKVYLIGTIVAQLLHRRWLWAEGALLATILVYLASYALFGSGTPFEIYENITGFAEGLVINNPLDIWMASSLLPLQQLTNSQVFPTLLYVGSRDVELIEWLVPFVMRSAQLVIMLAAAACFFCPEAVPRYRMVTLSIGIALLSAEVSAYTQVLVLLFCFMERGDGVLRRFAIMLGYLICVPLDMTLDRVPEMLKESFFFQTQVIVEYVVQVGAFVRPFLTLLIPVTLAVATLVDVYRDLQARSWKQRWRFRHDLPILFDNERIAPKKPV
jgi:hypothetical protein